MQRAAGLHRPADGGGGGGGAPAAQDDLHVDGILSRARHAAVDAAHGPGGHRAGARSCQECAAVARLRLAGSLGDDLPAAAGGRGESGDRWRGWERGTAAMLWQRSSRQNLSLAPELPLRLAWITDRPKRQFS